MQPVYKEIALLCYDAVTGGPEAIHQLSHTINSIGGNCGIAYIGSQSNASLVQDGNKCTLVCTPDRNSPAIAAYAKYSPRPIAEMALCSDNLLIVPEPMADMARNITFGHRAVWWLSVDNAMAFDPRLAYQSYRDLLFSDHTLMHLYQSDYARDFLLQNRARRVYPLSDYTDEIFLAQPAANMAAKREKIAYFPRKGGPLATEFVASTGQHLQLAPIENMSKTQVRETLEASAVYIDFGPHPGKDRVPREAAVSGAVVMLHEKGAAAHFADHPLDPMYLFSLADIRSGALATRVVEIASNYSWHFDQQKFYRQKIFLEKDEFTLQTKVIFFDGYI